MGRVTLQTIADAVGVSRMTVSNAFSRPDQLSEELRATILAKATELGYAGPDPAARNLARGRAGTVGILLSGTITYAFDDEPTAGFVGAIAAELAPTGSALTLLTSDDHDEFVPARDVALDGAVVYSCDQSSAIDWLIKRQLPLVVVDQQPLPEHDSVNIDDREGARLAAQHIVDLGHRRVAIATTSYGTSEGVIDDPFATTNLVSSQRLAGWLDAFGGGGLEPSVVQFPKREDAAASTAMGRLLDVEPRPTAVVCISDVVALGVARAAHQRGLKVPDDLSIVGFDGTLLAAFATPSLTTVRQDVAAKGRAAAVALVARMADPARPPSRVVIPVALVVGGSTGPPPPNS